MPLQGTRAQGTETVEPGGPRAEGGEAGSTCLLTGASKQGMAGAGSPISGADIELPMTCPIAYRAGLGMRARDIGMGDATLMDQRTPRARPTVRWCH